MPVHDDLGVRMKTYYEQISKFKLTRRTPVAIRLDGKAFHTFTRGFQKPFDSVLVKAMQETMKYLCEHIQGCVFGYTQSDEITLILVDYQTLTTSAWYDYEVQKMCSVSASMATAMFNKFFAWAVTDYIYTANVTDFEAHEKLINIYTKAIDACAMFDSRCFNIPKEEVCNLIYWRQLDAVRNSIQMVGQANFSHSELQNKSCNMIQDMLYKQKDINWNELPAHLKRGSACIKTYIALDANGNSIDGVRANSGHLVFSNAVSHKYSWIIDTEMPILKGQNRQYVDNLIFIGD